MAVEASANPSLQALSRRSGKVPSERSDRESLGRTVYTIYFTRLPGRQWLGLERRKPARSQRSLSQVKGLV